MVTDVFWGRVAATVLACLLLSASGAAARSTVYTERTEDDVIGASVAYPAKWSVERERYTLDETYGFTLWKPESGSSHDHGGTPALRVALAYGLRPEQIEATVREKLAAYSHLPVTREEISVGEGGRKKGLAVGPIPGSTPSTEVYVPVDGRVYQINVYGETLGAEDRKVLSSLRFDTPSRSVPSLGLPDANAPEVLYASSDPERERAAREMAVEEAPEATFETARLTGRPGSQRVAGGQTPASSSRRSTAPTPTATHGTASPRVGQLSANPTIGTSTPTAGSGTAVAPSRSGATTSSPLTIPSTAETLYSRPSMAAR
jgi:hypothetical protein